MQMRSKAYIHFIYLWRTIRDRMLPRDPSTSAETSPSLIYIAVVLTLLLAMLEVDVHRDELEALGLLADNFAVPAILIGP